MSHSLIPYFANYKPSHTLLKPSNVVKIWCVHIRFIIPGLGWLNGSCNYGLFGKFKHWSILFHCGHDAYLCELDAYNVELVNCVSWSFSKGFEGSKIGTVKASIDQLMELSLEIPINNTLYHATVENCQVFAYLMLRKLGFVYKANSASSIMPVLHSLLTVDEESVFRCKCNKLAFSCSVHNTIHHLG